MAITTSEDFLANLERSKLLSDEQLAQARVLGRRDDDPTTMARDLVRQGLVTRWQAGQLLAGRSSFFLGKYKLLELLGRGGMGGVFLGEHTTMNRQVAMKIISSQVGRDPASLARFLSEARAIAALDHPNIVQAYSVDNEGDRYYIVMEYVDGRDLQEILESDGPPDFAATADYIRQAAEGLAHGHRRNMIHCDIKPSNLLVNQQSVVKIVDMGLALLTGRGRDSGQGDLDNGQDGRVLGTVDYLAPEQALGTADFDHRADIYSLGCTLYFLLTGHPPFPEGTLAQRILKHQTLQPRSILEERPDAPADLVELCQQMMAKNPAQRPQSADEIARALTDWSPPTPQPQPAAPLKTAQPLAQPEREKLFSTEFDLEPGVATSGERIGEDSSRRRRLFDTRPELIVAAVAIALAAVVMLATTIALLIRPKAPPGPREPVSIVTEPNRTEPSEHTTARPVTGPVEPQQENEAEGQGRPRPPVVPPPPAEPPPAPAEPEPTAEDSPSEQPSLPEREPETEKPADPQAEQPEPRPKPRRTEPLHDLAKAVDLPMLAATAGGDGDPIPPVPLGDVDLQDDSGLEVKLVGGEEAIKSSRRFVMKRHEGDASWLIVLDADDKSSSRFEPVDVARIWLDGKTLKLQQLSGAKGRANCLRNCGLSIRAGEQSRWLPLSRARKVEPLLLDLQKGSARTLLSTELLPNEESLRLQVTGIEGPFPAHEFDPDNRVSKDGHVDVCLMGTKLPAVTLRVAMLMTPRSAAVEVSATFEMPDKERPLTLRGLGALLRSVEKREEQARKALGRLADGHPQGEELRRALDTAKKVKEQIKALKDLCKRLHEQGKIHFRVFADVDDHQLDLFTTQADEEP